MTAPSDLKELLARVEKATGPDDALDALFLKLERPDLDVRGAAVWRGYLCVGSAAEHLPPVTASLDASLALVERRGQDVLATLAGALSHTEDWKRLPLVVCAQLLREEIARV